MTRVADLTVAVATMDRPEALARCLEALLGGDALPAEVLVVDQGRADGAAPVVAGLCALGLPATLLRQERRGLAASRNLALERAGRPVVAVTDDDCVPAPGWVAALERAFAGPGAPDAAAGRVLPLGPDRPGLYAVSSRPRASRALFSGRTLPWEVGTGANFALRREWIERAGCYDERLGTGSPGGAGEDLDLIWRLLRSGARIRFEPEAVVYHERQPRERRLATRESYGRGVGACCGLWLRGGDLGAVGVLGAWLRLRTGLAARGLRHRRWEALREEALVLGGTARGLAYGLSRGRGARP